MKKDSLKDIHIGKIIKEIAFKKGISSKQIANAINRSESNSTKIFEKDDMNVEDIIIISYLLEYCILYFVVNEYLFHFQFIDHDIKKDYCLLKVDMVKNHITTYNVLNDCSFLKETHIGKHIRKVVKQKKWREHEVAKRLDCTQGMVSQLFQKKSLNVKKLIQISNALQYDFISRIYLSQIVIATSLNFLDDCIITVSQQQINITCSKDKTKLMQFLRSYGER
jgi:transcriptional regulator with XRE-family HTH domain